MLRENVAILEAESRCVILNEPAERGGWEAKGPFDLILMDPPYAAKELDLVLGKISQGEALKSGGILLLEHGPERNFAEKLGVLTLHSSRKLGPAGISVFLRC